VSANSGCVLRKFNSSKPTNMLTCQSHPHGPYSNFTTTIHAPAATPAFTPLWRGVRRKGVRTVSAVLRRMAHDRSNSGGSSRRIRTATTVLAPSLFPEWTRRPLYRPCCCGVALDRVGVVAVPLARPLQRGRRRLEGKEASA
jgi:hypothetical protein